MKTPTYIAALLAAISTVQAAPVVTDAVGFVSVTVPAHSDAILSVPMNRASEFKGIINSLSATTGSVTITVGGTSPAWNTAPQQFAPLVTAGKTYVVQIASGTKEGLILPVTANGANTLTVTVDPADDLAGVLTGASGDAIDVFPYWTPGSLMPATTPDGTELYTLKTARAGLNLGAEKKYIVDGGWIDQGSGLPTVDAPLAFGSAIIVRNNDAAALTVTTLGSVPMNAFRTTLRNNSATKDQDIAIGYSSPVPEPLLNLNIPAVDGDQLLIYDNTATGINKSSIPASLIMDGGWTFSNTGLPVPGTYTLTPGYGYIFRRALTGNTNTVVWTDLQGYLQ